MFSQIVTCGLLGLEGYRVLVETDLSNGLPMFDIVGLADTAVKEARERVRAAIRNSGHSFPSKRIIVNLAPADTKKEGAGFDLPIAVGVLTSMGILPCHPDNEIAFCGELALDGVLRPVNGMLSKAIAAREAGCRALVLPSENAREASWVAGLQILSARTLSDVCRHLTGECPLPVFNGSCTSQSGGGKAFPESLPAFPGQCAALPVLPALGFSSAFIEDFRDVRGQETAKRAMEVAAAGGHHLFMIGGPGAGKTMLAKRMPGILPEPDVAESLEITRIHSVAGLLAGRDGLVSERPFRSPHHTISNTGLIGGGRIPRPGEISLAHGGVLFLDELPEFNRAALDSLRQPLEDGRIVLARIHATITYPCRFMLVAAANPCKCGNYGDSARTCACPPRDAESYLSRLSGPLMDRMDLQIRVPALTYHQLSQTTACDSTAIIRERVNTARKRQIARYEGSGTYCNAQLTGSAMRQWCALDAESERLMEKAFRQLSLSMRAHDRILRVARTIADLDASLCIRLPHLAEAIQYRSAATSGATRISGLAALSEGAVSSNAASSGLAALSEGAVSSNAASSGAASVPEVNGGLSYAVSL